MTTQAPDLQALPSPGFISGNCNIGEFAYTAEQMRDYALAHMGPTLPGAGGGDAGMAHKARLWDDLMAAKNKPLELKDADWMLLADKGDVIPAIKLCRAANGYSLMEAKNAVEAYCERRRTAALPPQQGG